MEFPAIRSQAEFEAFLQELLEIAQTSPRDPSLALRLARIEFFSNGNPILSGTDDNGSVVGTDANENLAGLNGNDTLLANDGDNVLYGGLGDDKLNGGSGNDNTIGGEGSDRNGVLGNGDEEVAFVKGNSNLDLASANFNFV